MLGSKANANSKALKRKRETPNCSPPVILLYPVRRMLKELTGAVWRRAPRFVRRAGVWLTQPRFTVTAGAVICDERGRVLLLGHVLRGGSGWGIPGGFIHPGEQPDEAIRREMREETGLELEQVELAFVRTLKIARQVEIIFRASMPNGALDDRAESFEIDRAEWFAPDALPAGLTSDQRGLIRRVLGRGENSGQ
jgi:ADP-ribose pyrophosphatase YjhB (NUDIX family)